jgi:hypothetical protein
LRGESHIFRPKPEAEGSTNLQVSEVAERCENTSPSMADRGEHAIETAVDRLAQLKKAKWHLLL